MMIDKRLVNAVPQAKKFVIFTVLLQILGLISNTAFIFCTGFVLKAVKENERFLPLVFIMILCLCVSFCTAFLSNYTAFRASRNVKITLRSKIYEKILRLGPGYTEHSATGKLVQLATEGVEQLETWFSAFLPQFFYSMIASVLTFVFIAFLNRRMAIVLLCCIPLIPIAMMTVQGIAKKILGKYWEQYANLADNFLENLQGLTTLQIYQADEHKAKQMAKESENFRKVTMKVLSMQLNSIIIMDIVAYGGAALGIVFALSSFVSGRVPFYNAFICILLSADFFIPLRRLGSAFHTAMNGITSSKNIFELLNLPEPPDGTVELTELSASDESRSDDDLFDIKDLSYTFDRTVLQNVSLKIRRNSITAFVGKSGSGKSTVAKVLAGIYRNYTGSVLLGGTELRDVKSSSLHKNVSYISHRDWIFAGTVRDCLLEADENAADDAMLEVLREVQLYDFVNENGGLEMQLKEGGSNLSGGQKQRLSIARALLYESPVLIFDEATSNIDVESEEAIFKLISELKGKKTIILISHRKETCAIADCTYYFEDGKVSSEPSDLSSQAASSSQEAN